MNRQISILFVAVVLFSFLLFSCNRKQTKHHSVHDTTDVSAEMSEKGQSFDSSNNLKSVGDTERKFDFSKPFYCHYKGNYLAHKADLDITILRNSVFFTLCYYPEYKIVSSVAKLEDEGFKYAYVNKFGDTLEYWSGFFDSYEHFRLHVTTSVVDTTYLFSEDYSSSLPLNIYEIDTVLRFPDDTSRDLFILKLSCVYSPKLSFEPSESYDSLSAEVDEELIRILKEIKSYSKDELDIMFFPFNTDRLVNVEYNNNGLLVISSNSYIYMGGAHGLNGLAFYNIDVSQHKELKITDVLDTAGFSKMIWNKLKDKDILFVDENSIYVPKNFFLKGRKLFFVYNVYEIAPFSVGSITVSFDFAELKGRLKQDFLHRFYPDIKL